LQSSYQGWFGIEAGSGQIMDSMVTPSTAVALDYVDNASSGQDAYKDLLQKLRVWIFC
jgi:hypothetical protein